MVTAFSFSADSSDEKVLRVEAYFPAATAERLFRAFTDDAQLSQWWCQRANLDVRQGGAYELLWPAMNWRLWGQYRNVEDGAALVFTWNWEHEPDLPERVVSLTFRNAESGAALQLLQESYGVSEQEQSDRTSHAEGWAHFLSRLADFLLASTAS